MNSFIDNEFKKIKNTYDLINPKQLVSDANIDLLAWNLSDTHTGGFTVTNSRCSCIIYNSNWNEQYQQFVILHEFAHIKLHGGSSTPFYRHLSLDCNIPKMEREANTLAMKLLLNMQDSDCIKSLTKYQITKYLGIDDDLAEFIIF